MNNCVSRLRTTGLLLASLAVLAACSPKLDWREVRGTSPSFTILMPAKPTTLTRTVKLNGLSVAMTMTAAEVDGVTYAVGRARLPDASQAPAAVQAMKTALVRNIGGTIRKETAIAGPWTMVEIDALGSPINGVPSRLLAGRFAARGDAIYQVVVLGPERAIEHEAIDTFFTSFKIDQQ